MQRREKIAAFLVAAAFAIVCWIAPAQAADKSGDKNSPLGFLPIGEFSGKGIWTGIYVGAGVGYQVSDTELSFPGLSIIDGLSGSGWAGDVRAGFDIQLPGTSIVAGILGGYNLGSVKTEAFNGAASATLEPSWYVGGRLGFALPTKTLVYGGAAWQRAEGSLGGVLSGSATEDGIMYIAGIEQVVASNITLSAEYSLSQYEFTAGSLSIDPDVHAFKVRLNIRSSK